MKKYRFGVVGLGHRGRDMASLGACFDCVDFVAACDIIPENWYKKQKKWGGGWANALADIYPEVTFYDNYDKMLEEANLDIVLVETGADIHSEFCCKALRKNINVLSDIPLVANLKEAEEIWKAAQESKAIISVGANPNEAKFTVLLNEFYKKGLLGKPYCMEAEYIHWEMPGSHNDILITENGNWRRLLSPIRYCTHSLGPLLTILDEDLRYVSAFGTRKHGEDYPVGDHKLDDMVCAQFRTENNVVVRLMRNGRCRAKIGHHNYRVFGTQGYMERIERNDKPVIRYNSMRELDIELKEIGGEFAPPEYANDPVALEKGHGGMDYALFDHFFKGLEKGIAYIDVKEGLRMTLPGIYAEESSKRNGEILKIRYPWDEDWTTEL